ncbi:MAG: polymerase sigma-70 factor [Steroidobacteraceae bacterium]|jgi:RNA polymerase sigma-70 factor (ECF subfamily)|nr:polymerase sigma-70 factor [Steroidobacteraceae bacterium]
MRIAVEEGAAPREALLSLYRDHHRWLHAWIRRKLGCSHRADDLAHDTFCRLAEHHECIELRSPRGFLATVARRLLIDDSRRREIERTYLECYAEMHGDVDSLTPERIAEAAQQLDRILRVLRHLPTPVREAFLLRRCEALTHDQVAERMGISVRTVKRHIALAYQHCYVLAGE